MKVAFFTLGCKVNQYESESIREMFELCGHKTVSEKEDFDVLVLNSCSVTAESDRKTRQMLRHFRAKSPNSIIVLTGCMVQAFPDTAEELAEADIVIGNKDISGIVSAVESFKNDKNRILSIPPHIDGECFNTPAIKNFAERTRAYMKIEDGCNQFCTYCIIPYARGRVRSKPISELKNEAEALAQNGFVEIVLVGINLSAYNDNGLDICDAVSTVCSVQGIKRVRLGSLEPDHISNERLLRLKAEEKFCPQFHLSLQSGSDKTLKRMNRHYDTAFYKDLVTRIRNVFSDASITTDIMVGFAGETEEEFKESLSFVDEIGFARAHVFAYSRRSGTVAYNLPNQITRSLKSERSARMIELCAKRENDFLKNLIGKQVEVLLEENSEGYTKNYSRVKVLNCSAKAGETVVVTVKGVADGYCIAE